MIDLRSDTITKPDQHMRQAMAQAPVGDDVFGEDPTINELEALTAEILGYQAALYMPSGTMTNQIAVKAHTQPGDGIFLHEHAHIYLYEVGAPAALSGVMCNLLAGDRGIFTAETLQKAIRPANIHYPTPRLVCLENTHNKGGGSIWPLETIEQVSQTAREKGLVMHLDGARLWNAAAAMNVPEKNLAAKYFDSVSVCFSKGLGAPVGSCLAGGDQFIQRARHLRKMFGGGMRQAGIIAAGALYALKNNRPRLTEDHENAKLLAKGLADIHGIQIEPETVQTNIVIFSTISMQAEKLVEQLAKKDVLMQPFNEHTIRAVISLEVNSDQIRETVDIARKILKNSKYNKNKTINN